MPSGPVHKPDREVFKWEEMEEAMRVSLGSLSEEEMEFYTRGTVHMLRKQQQANRIPEIKFQRKFTALFRLYQPLLVKLVAEPEKLIKTYLMWENSFFNKVHLCHHRDSARTAHMEDIVRLADEPEDEASMEIATLAEKELSKLEAKRQKAAELAAKKKTAKPKAKKTVTIQWDAEENNLLMKHSLAMRKYLADAKEVMAAVKDEIDKTPPSGKALMKEQTHAKKCIGILRTAVAELQHRQSTNPDEKAHWARKMPTMRLLSILSKVYPSMYMASSDVSQEKQAQARARLGAIVKEREALSAERTTMVTSQTTDQGAAAFKQKLAIMEEDLRALDAEESELRLVVDGPFVGQCLESLAFLADAVRRSKADLDQQEKDMSTQSAAKVWLSGLVEWGDELIKFQEQESEDFAMMEEEQSLIERKEKYEHFVGTLRKDGRLDLDKDLNAMHVFERREVKKKVEEKAPATNWREKEKAKQKAAEPDAETPQPKAQPQQSEHWKEKQARLDKEKQAREEAEAAKQAEQRAKEADEIDIPDDEDEDDEELVPAFRKEFAKGKVDKGDARLSEAEFREYDKDGSGEIDEDEFKALVRDKGWIFPITKEELKLAWGRIDRNGDGSISLDELQEWWSQGPGDRFKNMVASPAEKRQLEWAAKTFREVDGDGNELLDASEFQGLHAAMVERGIVASGLSCEEALKSLDRDGDGEIKLEEFIVWLLDSSKPVDLGRPAPRSKPATPAAQEDEQAKLAMLQGTASSQEAAQLAALSGATAKEAEDIDIPDDDEPEPEPEPEPQPEAQPEAQPQPQPDAATEASKLAELNALGDGGGLAVAPTKARARQGGKAPPTRRRTQSKDSEAAKLAALENL